MTPAALVLALLEIAGGPRGAKLDDVQALAPVLLEEARAASFDPLLLGAIAFAESGYRQHAHGRAREVGVFQVKPDGMGVHLCGGLVVSRLRDNVRCAIRILEHARRACGGGPQRWLSAYNGRRCGSSAYSSRVLTLRRKAR